RLSRDWSSDVFSSDLNIIIEFASRMNERGIKPELECFDKSHVDMALRLVRKGHIKPPLHFNFVLGVNGGATGTPRDLLFLKESRSEERRGGYACKVYC